MVLCSIFLQICYIVINKYSFKINLMVIFNKILINSLSSLCICSHNIITMDKINNNYKKLSDTVISGNEFLEAMNSFANQKTLNEVQITLIN